jgi:hypothetical protein
MECDCLRAVAKSPSRQSPRTCTRAGRVFQSFTGLWWQKALDYVEEETQFPASLGISSAIDSVQGTMGLELIYPGLWWRPPEDIPSYIITTLGQELHLHLHHKYQEGQALTIDTTTPNPIMSTTKTTCLEEQGQEHIITPTAPTSSISTPPSQAC